MRHANRWLLLCWAAVLAFGGPALAQSPGHLDALFQPWTATRRGGEVPGEFNLPGLRGRAHLPSAATRLGRRDVEDAVVPDRIPRGPVRSLVEYPTKEPAGTIVIDTPNTALYLVVGGGKAIRYAIGVGREGFTWTGRERISRMAEWPEWRPPPEMIERDPYLPRYMAGGLQNPLGARALYLGNTLYRIHGTNQPSSIGTFESSGCFRMLNEDVIDLYQRVSVGAQVVVLDHDGAAPRSSRRRTER